MRFEADGQKVTLVRSGMMGGSSVIHARLHAVAIQKQAQYPSAVAVVYTPKGGRKKRWFVLTSEPQCVIVTGWVDAKPIDWMGETKTAPDGTTYRESRYTGFDRAGQADDIAKTLESIEAGSASVLVDARGHNASDAVAVTSVVGRQLSALIADQVMAL